MSKLSKAENDLITRYLIWCYKTTKEDIDRIDRYFTQNIADKFILKHLKKNKEYHSRKNDTYKNCVDDFESYLENKFQKAVEKKFVDEKKRQLRHDYLYMKNRLSAIEKAIEYFLGMDELNSVVQMYEQEMTKRILEAREHT